MSNQRIALRPVAAVVLAALALLAAQPVTGQSAAGAARTQDGAELEALRSRLLDTERELHQLNRQLEELKSERASAKDVFGRGFSAAPAIVGGTLFSHARIGITVDTDETPESGGVLVEEVVPDGPADRAGLEPGDVITHWNGRELGAPPRRSGAAGVLGGRSGSANRLLDLARALDPGDEVALRVRRNDDSLELTVVAERAPLLAAENFHYESPAVAAVRALEAARSTTPLIPGSDAGFAWAFGGRSLWGDVELVRVDAELGEYFGTEEGLLVLRTPEGDSFGLRAGDVILRIGEREPRDATHGLRILRSYDAGENVNLYVVRKGERITLTASVPAAEKTSFSWSLDGSKI
ncbi:MAG TPA: PDZ domain-containing protein [Thermoanaerobaculia bacterium]|nr:PDZ domain-containing protein [Thermoanaerobaculia bacterium]